MRFLRIQERKKFWIILICRRLNDLIRADVENEQEKENSKINPGGVSIEGAQGVERVIASRKLSEYKPSPSTAEIALWQLLLLPNS
jgi:hypothetical protein